MNLFTLTIGPVFDVLQPADQPISNGPASSPSTLYWGPYNQKNQLFQHSQPTNKPSICREAHHRIRHIVSATLYHLFTTINNLPSNTTISSS